MSRSHLSTLCTSVAGYGPSAYEEFRIRSPSPWLFLPESVRRNSEVPPDVCLLTPAWKALHSDQLWSSDRTPPPGRHRRNPERSRADHLRACPLETGEPRRQRYAA